jgi:predicted Zn finger-like uncharacterized protein
MIIECPSCLTRYDTPAQIPEEGRNVRCAKCEHVWLVRADDKPIDPDPEIQADDETVAASDADAAAGEPAEVEETPDSAEESESEDAGSDEPTVDEDTLAAAEDDTSEDAKSDEPTVDEDTLAAADAADDAALGDEDPLSSDDIDWGDDDDEIAVEETPDEAPKAEPEPEPEPVAASEPTLDEAAAAPEEDADAGMVEDEAISDDDESDVPPIVIPEEQPAAAMDTKLMAGWAGLALFVVLTVTLLITQRVGVVSALPGAASAYSSIGLPVNVRGLDFDKVTSTWTVEAGRSILEIHGDIVNVTDDEMSVPTVVFALRNAKGLEVYQWAAEVRNEPLAGGERTPFVARIPTPPKSIKNVQVKFAKAR